MRQRREVWEKLSKETKDFVFEYLKNNLKLKESEFENFLFPDFDKTILNGMAMQDMGKAVERILAATKNEEKIAVYGDYDCDGVPGTALVRDFFEKINYSRVVYYIPHRHTEGYGLNKQAIQTLADQGVSLILTIDLGTTNIEEVEFANTLKIDTIITDHHLPLETEDGQILPKAYAIINNKQNSCDYSNKDLCGSGTVYKLIVEILNSLKCIYTSSPEKKSLHLKVECSGEAEKMSDRRDKALSSSARRDDIFSAEHWGQKFGWKDFEKVGIKLPQNGYEKWLLDLVAIATIADMVPLVYENRTLAIYGLYVLSKTGRVGLQTLFKNAKTELQKVNEQDVAFTIAPRINSASRMAHPKIALSMFSQNLEEGINAAHELEDLNSTRKETTKNITKKIYKLLDERIENSKDKKLPEIVVIGDTDWNAGVLGILATKILEKYNVNVFCFGGADEKSDEDFSNSNQVENSQFSTSDINTKKLQTLFRGSCRSRGDIHLVKLMTQVKEKFVHFGGHELAGGFTVSFENLHTLEGELNKNIEHARIENVVEQKRLEQQQNVIKINLEKITADFFEGLKLIGPFGVGNPKPVFKIENILETKVDRFGKSKEHLKLKLVGKNLFDKRFETEAIKFFVEKSEEEEILENYKNGNLFFEIEPGWNSHTPRLKIIV